MAQQSTHKNKNSPNLQRSSYFIVCSLKYNSRVKNFGSYCRVEVPNLLGLLPPFQKKKKKSLSVLLSQTVGIFRGTKKAPPTLQATLPLVISCFLPPGSAHSRMGSGIQSNQLTCIWCLCGCLHRNLLNILKLMFDLYCEEFYCWARERDSVLALHISDPNLIAGTRHGSLHDPYQEWSLSV